MEYLTNNRTGLTSPQFSSIDQPLLLFQNQMEIMNTGCEKYTIPYNWLRFAGKIGFSYLSLDYQIDTNVSLSGLQIEPLKKGKAE